MMSNTKFLWVLAVLVLIGAGAYLLQNVFGGPEGIPNAVREFPHSLRGTVTEVGADHLIVTTTTSLNETVSKTVPITSETRIEKTVRKVEEGVTQATFEVNVTDVSVGNIVTIGYKSERGNVLSGVARIRFSVEGDVQLFKKEQEQKKSAFLTGEIVSVNLADRYFELRVLSQSESTTTRIQIPNTAHVYRVNDIERSTILHARIEGVLQDIVAGKKVLIPLAPGSREGTFYLMLDTLIVSGNN